MRVEELRIDNWVEDIVSYRFVKIDGIESNHDVIWVNYKNGSAQYDLNLLNLQPIPLTEEVLLKCGFEQKDHLFRLHLVNSIYIEFNSECNLWYFDIYMNTSRIELQYLHELQNIYSSITFKELEINL